MEEGSQFFIGFFPFAFRIRGIDDSRTRLQCVDVPLFQGTADSNAKIQISIGFQVADGASVKVALFGFQRRNDFDGADFGCAADGPRWKYGLQNLNRLDVAAIFSFHFGNDMDDMAEQFAFHVPCQMDASRLAHSP